MEYTEMLTRAILDHRLSRRPIHWADIANQALGFCANLTLWEHSARWFIGPFKAAGLNWEDASPRTKPVFFAALSAWMILGPYHQPPLSNNPMVEGVGDLLRRKIRHIVRLAPARRNETDSYEALPIELPTIRDFRYKIGTLTHKRAARYLGCDPCTIRNYLRKGELTRAAGGKVSCDDKWTKKLLAKRGSAVKVM